VGFVRRVDVDAPNRLYVEEVLEVEEGEAEEVLLGAPPNGRWINARAGVIETSELM